MLSKREKQIVALGAETVAAVYERQLAALAWERAMLMIALDRAFHMPQAQAATQYNRIAFQFIGRL